MASGFWSEMPLNTASSLALCCQNLHRPAFSVNTGIWT